MVKYSGMVSRASGVAHPLAAHARLEIRLVEPATRAGTLVNTDIIYVDVPNSGAFSVELIPSSELKSKSGRPALYTVAESWLDSDGVQVPGGYVEWGTFYLRADGGQLASHLLIPPLIPGLYVRGTDPALDGPVRVGDFWIREGQILEQTQDGWVPRGNVASVTDSQMQAILADAGSSSSEAITSRVTTAVDTAVAPVVTAANAAADDAAEAATSAQAAATTAANVAAQSVRRLDAPGQRAVFIGASNVVPGTWPEKLGAVYGWTVHNHARGGTSFIQGGPSNMPWSAQLEQAISASYPNAEVAFVFIAGAGNDVRAGNNPVSQSQALFTRARQAFPNARVIVLPVMWGHADLNRTTEALGNLGTVTNTIRESALSSQVEFIEWVHLWHWDSEAWMVPGEVHFTADGDDRTVQWISRYLSGQSTDPVRSWVKAGENAGVDVVSYNAYRAVSAQRQGEVVTVDGSWLNTTARSASDNLFRFPVGLRPGREVKLPGRILSGGASGTATVYTSGWVRFDQPMPLNSRCHIGGDYSVF